MRYRPAPDDRVLLPDGCIGLVTEVSDCTLVVAVKVKRRRHDPEEADRIVLTAGVLLLGPGVPLSA